MALLVIKLAIQLGLATMFSVAGIAKLKDRAKTAESLAAFGVPVRLAGASAVILPGCELAAAFGLLLPAFAWPAATGAALLLGVFTLIVGINLALGRHLDCNCFGQAKATPIGPVTLARNVLLTGLAAVPACFGPAYPPPQSWDGLPTLAAWILLAVAVAAFAAVAVVVTAVRIYRTIRRNKRMTGYRDVLAAFTGRANISVKPASLGLPVGSVAPHFELPKSNGDRISLKRILASKRRTLLVFLSSGCPACEILALEVTARSRDRRRSMMIVMVYEGDVVRAPNTARVLYQNDREVADAYRSWGSPEAVWIDVQGKISSPLIKGVAAIRGAIMEEDLSGVLDRPLLLYNAEAPPAGLRIGELPPAVALEDQKGRSISFEDFEGRELLVIFWSSTCSYCRVLLDMLKSWEKSPPPWAPTVLMLRTDRQGPAAASTGLKLPVAFDPDKTLMSAFGVHGTPSGILLDAAGRVASANAAGPDAIMALANGIMPAPTGVMQQ